MEKIPLEITIKDDTISTPIRGLSAIAEAKNYLLNGYERYVRDANIEINQKGN
ncbi:hypothetical protein J0871_17155 [Salegentibacter sp. BDJ18]|uniref:hypothetical protein n=1 Tax=Salegentibacter sp. BDJ18 TaxID=2816376 RepID=UPI001AAFAE83|nr:hypothetical protein [Salegentibacter sp. BDJ18]MBO2546147.1 hypothetical protein [Salegentibacter sp. BDJ18]